MGFKYRTSKGVWMSRVKQLRVDHRKFSSLKITFQKILADQRDAGQKSRDLQDYQDD